MNEQSLVFQGNISLKILSLLTDKVKDLKEENERKTREIESLSKTVRMIIISMEKNK